MPSLVVGQIATMPLQELDERRNYRPLTRKIAFSPGQQLSIEFQKCEAMCKRLQLDRASTTIGFDINPLKKDHLYRSSGSGTQRHLPDSSSSRAKTAPGILTKSTDFEESGVQHKLDTCRSDFNQDDKPAHISPDALIEILTTRGVGSPRWYRYPPAPPEAVICKHYSKFRKVSYYMEKLKGQSRIDCEIANSKATAFCEEQREVAHAQNRKTSAIFRSRFRSQPPELYGDGRSVMGSKEGVNTQADTTDRTDGTQNTVKTVYKRIKTWMEDCELALNENTTTEASSQPTKKSI